MSIGERSRWTDISVVIPTLGRPILERCLEAIADGDSWPTRIIVVDQSSSETVAGQLRSLERRGIDTLWVPSTETGRSAGVNRGLERVETPLLAVTDDDCLAERDWLRRMRSRLLENRDTIVSGRVEPEGEEEAVAVVTDLEPATYRTPSLKFDAMSGGNMGTWRDVVERVGLFDEDPSLRQAEDCDWSYRALRSQIAILYAPEVCVRHYAWRDSGQRADQYRAYARSHGGFYGKYLRRGDGFIALRAAVHMARAARRWLVGSLTGDRDKAERGRAYVTGLPRGIVAGMRREAP